MIMTYGQHNVLNTENKDVCPSHLPFVTHLYCCCQEESNTGSFQFPDNSLKLYNSVAYSVPVDA